MISLTATFTLAARQTLTYKQFLFLSNTLQLRHLCNLLYDILTLMESISDLSLQRQGTAIRPHRCAHYGGTKGVWESAGKDGEQLGAWSTLTVPPAMTAGALPPNTMSSAPRSLPSTGRDIALCHGANTANMPKRKHCGMAWSVPALFLKGKLQSGWGEVLS